MPLYEYQCDACAVRFERIQKFSDPLVDACPACGGSVRKLLSSPAIQFKGSGWYITDYAQKGKSESAGASSGQADASKTDKSEKAEKTESKTEKKSDTGSAPASATPSPKT